MSQLHTGKHVSLLENWLVQRNTSSTSLLPFCFLPSFPFPALRSQECGILCHRPVCQCCRPGLASSYRLGNGTPSFIPGPKAVQVKCGLNISPRLPLGGAFVPGKSHPTLRFHFINKLYPQHVIRTHNPETKSLMLYQLRHLGTPPAVHLYTWPQKLCFVWLT